MVLVYYGLILYSKLNIVTKMEKEIYSQVNSALCYLMIGFFFYATHTPERFLTNCFDKSKNSRFLGRLFNSIAQAMDCGI